MHRQDADGRYCAVSTICTTRLLDVSAEMLRRFGS